MTGAHGPWGALSSGQQCWVCCLLSIILYSAAVLLLLGTVFPLWAAATWVLIFPAEPTETQVQIQVPLCCSDRQLPLALSCRLSIEEHHSL